MLRELAFSMDCAHSNVAQLAERCVARGLMIKSPGGHVQLTEYGTLVAAGLDLVSATEAQYVEAALWALRRDLEAPRPMRITVAQRDRLGVQACYEELVDGVREQASAEWKLQRAQARLGAA